MVLYTSSNVCVHFIGEKGVYLISWKVKPSLPELQETYLQVLHYATGKYSSTLFCTDISQCGPLDYEQELWLNTEYAKEVVSRIPTAIHVAVVFSEEHFKALVTHYRLPETDLSQPEVHYNYFTRTEEAVHWLENIKKDQDAALIQNNIPGLL